MAKGGFLGEPSKFPNQNWKKKKFQQRGKGLKNMALKRWKMSIFLHFVWPFFLSKNRGLAKNRYHHRIGRKKIRRMVYSDREKLIGRPIFGTFSFFSWKRKKKVNTFLTLFEPGQGGLIYLLVTRRFDSFRHERCRPLLKRGLSLFLRVELGCSTLIKNVSLKGNLTAPGPQKNVFFGPGVLPQAPFFVKNMFLVLVRCRRRLFLWKNAFLVLERCRRRLFFGGK